MLSLVNFFKGPVGMAVMGSVVTIGTAVTGVTAGPSVARVSEALVHDGILQKLSHCF